MEVFPVGIYLNGLLHLNNKHIKIIIIMSGVGIYLLWGKQDKFINDNNQMKIKDNNDEINHAIFIY